MSKVSKHFPIFILAAVLGAPAMRAQSLPPSIFFTDLTSGPNTGGENNNGTILTIYGKNFGAARGTSTVTVGGGAVAAYLQWGVSAPGELGTQKISVAIGAAARTGSVVVTTSNGASNAITFTVRSGNIFCVSTTGNDANSGQFPGSCWATPVQAKNTMVAGDITYILNGVTATLQDNDNAVVDVASSGTAASPIALVGYPGASVTIGSNALDRAFSFPSSSATSYWTIAGISTIRAGSEAFNMNDITAIRIVGNDISCPNGDGPTACVLGDGGNGSGLKFLGNYLHDSGNTCVDCHTYHSFYNSTNNVSWEAAWNTIAPDPGHTGKGGCRAIEVFSTGGVDEYDIHIHDNIIHDAIADAIDVVNVNPDGTNTMGGQGSIEIYNNKIYHVGTGPDPGSSSNYSCIQVGALSAHTNPVEIYNNSFYDCGSRGNSDSGMFSFHDSNIKARFRNNIIQATGSEPYFTPGSGSTSCSNSSGSNNVWFGAGAPPCGSLFTSNINSDPKYLDPVTAHDFHLQSGSPAIDVGVTISTLLRDSDGVTRPQGAAYDIGAYEFVNGNPPVRPNPPANLRAVVR